VLGDDQMEAAKSEGVVQGLSRRQSVVGKKILRKGQQHLFKVAMGEWRGLAWRLVGTRQ
jgi:hypothetical protein